MFGGHWFAPQAIAWARMIVASSQAVPLVDAAVETFSGKKPCRLCHEIRERKSTSEQASPRLLSVLKFECTLMPQNYSLESKQSVLPPSMSPSELRAWTKVSFQPPTPPPKFV